MKGKKGPVPPPIDDPTEKPIEEIVGEENIITLDNASEKLAEVVEAMIRPELEQQPAERQGYKCMLSGCTFQTTYLSEMEEHVTGTGHGAYVTDTLNPVQPELFSTKFVFRGINVPLPDDLLNDKRARLAKLYQSALDVKDEKKAADDDFNARLKNIDSQMQEIARILKAPFTYERKECEWKILEGENARGLFRVDTGEMVEKQPLTAEDFAALEEKAAKDNAEAAAVSSQ